MGLDALSFGVSFSLWGRLCPSQPLWLFCILVLERLFLFLFGPLFSPSPGLIQGSATGSKKPLKCWLLWEHFKRPFHHVHEAALETKLKYDLCETSISSLESFVAPLSPHTPFSVSCLFCSPAIDYLKISMHVHNVSSWGGRRKVSHWIPEGNHYVDLRLSVSRTMESRSLNTTFLTKIATEKALLVIQSRLHWVLWSGNYDMPIRQR